MINTKNGIIMATAIIVVTMFVAGSVSPMSEYSHGPRIKDKYGNSLNWAGYAVTGPAGSVTDVKGSWIVPTADCSSTPNSYSSFWLGIDGYSSSTVEQTGTSSDCNGNSPSYYAWYEFYPKFGYKIPMQVSPGNVISAEVKYTGKGQFTVSIANLNTSQSFSKSAKVSQAQMSSAEWIAEAPWSGGVLPLANFGTAYFGLDKTGVSSTNYATVGGSAGNISSFGSSVQSITMVSNSGATKANPSPLSTDGTSFAVQWVSAGP